MRVPILPFATTDALPLWPPLLATRGPGSRSSLHSHHAMHFVLSIDGELRVRAGTSSRWRRAAGVLTAPDVRHAIDARGVEMFLVFLDPDSDVAGSLRAVLEGPARLVSPRERRELVHDAEPGVVMRSGGVEWTRRVVEILGGAPFVERRVVHPRVLKLLRLLRSLPPSSDTSLPVLARAVGLSPSRLMHAFTRSVGVPLRPYLAWLRLQRAAVGIVAGQPLTEVAHAAGFADAAHMSRTFRRMFGVAPSALRPGHP